MKKEIEQKVDIDYADRVVPEEGKPLERRVPIFPLQ